MESNSLTLPIAGSPVRRIVLCRTGGIGDVIHTLPLAKYLKKKYQNTSIEYVTSENVAALLNKACPYIDKVWNYKKSNKRELAQEIIKNEGKINYFFNLHGSLSFFLFNFLHIKGEKYFHYKKDLSLHAVVNFARTYDSNLSALNLERHTLLLGKTKDILDTYGLNGLKEKKYVCFVPGVGRKRPHRGWYIEKWAELTQKYLRSEKDMKVVYLGGTDEMRLIGYLPEDAERIVNLIGVLSLTETANIISASKYLVSADTGLLHIASALGIKVIGLYGPTLPKRTGPFSGDYQIVKAKDCECIGNIFDLKKCKLTKQASGYCMNNLKLDEILYYLSHNVEDLAIV